MVQESPINDLLQGEFMVIETDKKVYYPGEVMECTVNLRLQYPITRAESIVFQIKSQESFKFVSKVKNQRSLSNKRTIVDQTYTVCRFMPSELGAPGDYTFMFKYKIPTVDTTSQQTQQ